MDIYNGMVLGFYLATSVFLGWVTLCGLVLLILAKICDWIFNRILPLTGKTVLKRKQRMQRQSKKIQLKQNPSRSQWHSMKAGRGARYTSEGSGLDVGIGPRFKGNFHTMSSRINSWDRNLDGVKMTVTEKANQQQDNDNRDDADVDEMNSTHGMKDTIHTTTVRSRGSESVLSDWHENWDNDDTLGVLNGFDGLDSLYDNKDSETYLPPLKSMY
eukprot:CFRG6501T1